MKTALVKQKRLITIFLMTIVLPSVVLSIFAVRAIRNEKYRYEQQILNDHQNTLMLLKKQFSGQMKNMEAFLQNTAQLPVFRNKEYSAIRQNLNISLTGNTPIDQVYILFEDGQSFFPQLQPAPEVIENSETVLTAAQQTMQARAWKAEFKRHDYNSAIYLFGKLANNAKGRHTRAQMLNHLARVQKKSGKIVSAIRTYRKIIEQYPSSLTSARLPLALTAEMQIVDCERISGHKGLALKEALVLYEKILEGDWVLSENQFLNYAELTKETVAELLGERSAGDSNKDQRLQYSALQDLHQKRTGQWKVRRQIESEFLPELKEMTKQFRAEPIRLSRLIQGKDFMITAVPVSGFLCIKWDNDRLIHEWLQPIVEYLQLNERFNIIITDLSGKILLGDELRKDDLISITGDFDNYFPPWKIRIVQSRSDNEIGINLFKSYYFWSILTLLMILVFGTLLIIRTIVREREVIGMKSDFVSSVSHELKTLLINDTAPTERLLEGKVKSPQKMHQYFSLIDHDANKLTRLVKNILDFSKIEAGKIEYSFEATDVSAWLDETIDSFINDHIHDQIEIRKHFDPDVPSTAIDHDALSQCLNNLLDNAIKFSPNSKSVDVYLQKESEFVIIRVQDYGMGIPKKDLDRIFDRFFQGTPSGRQSVKGTGLGLALVRHAIEAHGGRVSVESSPGQGSIFTIFLPIVNPNL